MPGGAGTMDEFFETLTLIQTATIRDFPIVLIGKDYYKDIWEMLTKMEHAKTISPSDLNLVKFTDDIDEAMNHLEFYIKRHYKFKHVKPTKMLWERFI